MGAFPPGAHDHTRDALSVNDVNTVQRENDLAICLELPAHRDEGALPGHDFQRHETLGWRVSHVVFNSYGPYAWYGWSLARALLMPTAGGRRGLRRRPDSSDSLRVQRVRPTAS